MRSKTITSGGSVSINTDVLAALRKELADNKGAVVQVGVLGSTNARADSMGNAEIGAVHEFGSITKKMPERSFLRMPIIGHMPAAIYSMGKETWRRSILEKGVIVTLKRLGILAESVVQDAFATGGFGLWPKISKVTIRRKKSAAILIDTAQLRQSITSRVVKP